MQGPELIFRPLFLTEQSDIMRKIPGGWVKMKKHIRIILIAVLACVLAASVGMLIYKQIQYKQGQDSYSAADKLAGLAGIPTDAETDPDASQPADNNENNSQYYQPYAAQLNAMDVAALKKVNSDVMGWILIPGTAVSYPLVHSTDRADTFYLNHTWDAAEGIVGSIFVEPENSGGLNDFNTVIYGHNMKDGSMFGSLKSFGSANWWKAHPGVYISTAAGTRYYKIFAAYEVSTSGKTYQISFSSDKTKQAFIDFCLAQSAISTGVTPTVDDNIITLSTCTGRGHATRWVVQAVMTVSQPKAAAPSAALPAPTAVPTQAPAEDISDESTETGAEPSDEAAKPTAG